ncbi:hypothetical protein [Deinococcus terrestris]|nr:hypothetical protein [Deinococcus terrestris]
MARWLKADLLAPPVPASALNPVDLIPGPLPVSSQLDDLLPLPAGL